MGGDLLKYSRWLASGLAVLTLVLLHASVLHLLWSEGPPLSAALAILTLVAIGAAAGDAVVWVAETSASQRSRESRRGEGYALPLLWLGMTLSAAVMWPMAIDPETWRLSSLFFFTTLAAFPAALAEHATVESNVTRLARWWHRLVVWTGLTAGIVAAVRYAIALRPYVEGVDFYFYVYFARELWRGALDLPLAHFHYFPGVYEFWRAGLLLGNGSSAALQWMYLALLGTNALVIAAIVIRACRSVSGGLLAGLWYAILCSEFEGFYATTEPVATLPVLIGVLLWGGVPLWSRRGVLRALALGAAFGIGIYAKQQGVLQTAGWLSIVATHAIWKRADRRAWARVIIVPAATAVVGLGLIGLERHSVEYLTRGLIAVGIYPSRATLIENLAEAHVVDNPVALGGAMAFLGWLVVAAWPRARGLLRMPWCGVLGFASIAGLAGLVQYTKQPYQHYTLLAGPFLIVAAVVGAIVLVRWASRTVGSAALIPFVAVGIAAIPLTRPQPYTAGLALWPPSTTPRLAHQLPWRLTPDVADDITRLRAAVRPGEDLLVLPPRRNELHMLLGTRWISFDYEWWNYDTSAVRAVRSPTLAAVIVIRTHLDETDWMIWKKFDCDAAVAELGRAGFRPVVSGRAMTLWRRAAPVSVR